MSGTDGRERGLVRRTIRKEQLGPDGIAIVLEIDLPSPIIERREASIRQGTVGHDPGRDHHRGREQGTTVTTIDRGGRETTVARDRHEEGEKIQPQRARIRSTACNSTGPTLIRSTPLSVPHHQQR